MTGHVFHPSFLREYDARGIVGETLSEADALALGLAFGTVLMRGGRGSAAVGRDGRLSSPGLEAALVEGLSAAGVAVTRIGLGPTPMLYFAMYHLGLDGGVMVTGSHNPPDYNGFKMVLQGEAFFGAHIRALGPLAAAGDFAAGKGAVSEAAVEDAYVARLAGEAGDGPGLRVGWDAGNGSAGRVMARLTARLPGEHFLLNEEIDGTFPAHHPDPTVPENLVQLVDLVRREGLDLGIALDGDGDRLGAVDGEGDVLWADQLLILLARDLLAERPGAGVIADVKASQALFDAVAEAGGRPEMWKTGHTLIKSRMAETGTPLAGEMSGHIFFADRWYGFDDGLYAALRLLKALERSGLTLAEFRRSLPVWINTPELRFPCPETRKFAVPGEVAGRLAAAGADVNATDGVRVATEDGWWLLRASNTQDALVARCEAHAGAGEAGLDRLKAALAAELRASGVEPPAI